MDSSRATRRRFAILAAAIVGATSWHSWATAQTSISLPTLSSCKSAVPPTLPKRWHAVGLMSPFLEGQLDIGDFVYDAAVPAMRATVYGLESGAADLLITDAHTYQLSGPYGAPTGCATLDHKFNLPSVRWLPDQAVCVGDTRIDTTPVEWWKAPGSGTQAHWFWLNSDTRLPWRTLFLTPSADPPIIGDYAMTYFPTFTELPQTNLSHLRDFCASRAKKAPAETDGADTARALMAIPNEAAEGERHDRVGTLIPGLSHQPCAHAKTPNWPERFATTAFLTPISFGDDPYATLILYDWSETASQFAVMFQNTPPAMKALVALKKNVGYRIYPHVSGPICEPVYPGLVRPDWMKVAWCQCKGVIDHNPALSPNDVTQILSCPIKWQNRRIMWSWYTANDRPVVFVEAGARGDGGVLLADYDRWLPGEKVTAKNFDLPNSCPAPDKAIRPPAHGDSLANNSCTDCHTTPW
jgi:hypothetical protein